MRWGRLVWDWVRGVGYFTDHDDACSLDVACISLGLYWTDLLAAVGADRRHWSLLLVAPSSHVGCWPFTGVAVFLEK